MKQCRICCEERPLTDYYRNHARCKRCYMRHLQSKYDPVKTRNKNLKRLYGITLEDYDRMFEEQDGQCKLCGTRDPGGRQTGRGTVDVFFVDHCHTTGKIRGLLCNTCNRAIGQVGENLSFFENAISYLKANT